MHSDGSLASAAKTFFVPTANVGFPVSLYLILIDASFSICLDFFFSVPTASRLRVSLSAAHTYADVDALVAALKGGGSGDDVALVQKPFLRLAHLESHGAQAVRSLQLPQTMGRSSVSACPLTVHQQANQNTVQSRL